MSTGQPSRTALELPELLGRKVVILHWPEGVDDENLSGRDIDCAADGSDPRWPLRLSRWRLYQGLHYDLQGWFWVLGSDGDLLALDVIDDPYGLGRDAIPTARVVNGEERLYASASLRAAYLAIKRTRKGNRDPAEWARIGHLAREDAARFTSTLEMVAGPRIARLLSQPALAGVIPPESVLREVNRLRQWRRFGSVPRVSRAASAGVRRYLHRITRPSGLSLLVIGPDGAGKSSVGAQMTQATEGLFKRYQHSHWRPGLLPRPGSIVGKAPSDPTEPHGRSPFGPVLSLLLTGYYWFDFAIEGWLLQPSFRVRSGLLVRERGWWDMAVDPARYRLDVSPRIIQALGTLLPHPDLMLELRGDPELLHSRKPELDPIEIERQMRLWERIVPARSRHVVLDASKPLDDVVASAREAVCESLEQRAISRLAEGWAAIPPGCPRWWLPRGPAPLATTALRIFQPVTTRGRIGWSAAGVLASRGGFRLLPRGGAPPREVRRALAPYVPMRGSYAVARANHPHRYVGLVMGEDGRPHAFVKVDTSGSSSLATEGQHLDRLSAALPSGLRAPRVLARSATCLVLEPIAWRPRQDPWWLPTEVAAALGGFFAAGSGEGPERTGFTHGDVAPWNLLATDDGWALVDWESARQDGPAFHDVCHFVVQAHTLLGTPVQDDVVSGFRDLRGGVGTAVMAYAHAAGLDPNDAAHALVAYLRRTEGTIVAKDEAERRGLARRAALLVRLEG